MNRSDIIKAISQETGIPQNAVTTVLDSLNRVAVGAIQMGSTVDIHGLLKLKVQHKPARTGRNPKTGATLDIPAKNVVKITPAKALTDAANT